MIYLDHNATTPPCKAACDIVQRMTCELWANPSSTHRGGQQARREMELAREKIAKLINARPADLTFTSGGTEANQIALLGMLAPVTTSLSAKPRGGLLTMKTEHPSVRSVATKLESTGYPVGYVSPSGRCGQISAEDVIDSAHKLTEDILAAGGNRLVISLMWANNETGLIHDIPEITQRCAELRQDLASQGISLFMHSDAVQALGKIPVDLPLSGLDMVSFSAHKIGGIKGCGVLWLKRGVKPLPMFFGGHQEKTLRPGTENILGACSFGEAAEIAKQQLDTDPAQQRLHTLRSFLFDTIKSHCPEAIDNTADLPRLANTLSVGFPCLAAEGILVGLSEAGIYASAGSACSSGSIEASPVLLAAGISEEIAHGSVRFSLSTDTTEDELSHAATHIGRIVKQVAQWQV